MTILCIIKWQCSFSLTRTSPRSFRQTCSLPTGCREGEKSVSWGCSRSLPTGEEMHHISQVADIRQDLSSRAQERGPPTPWSKTDTDLTIYWATIKRFSLFKCGTSCLAPIYISLEKLERLSMYGISSSLVGEICVIFLIGYWAINCVYIFL